MKDLETVEFPELLGTHLSDEDEFLLEHWDQGLDCDVTSCTTQTKSQVGNIQDYSDLFGEISDDDEDDDVDDDGKDITDNDVSIDSGFSSDSDSDEEDMEEESSDSDSDSSDSDSSESDSSDSDSSDNDSSDSETDSDDDSSDSDSDNETPVRKRKIRPMIRNRRTSVRKPRIRPIARIGRTARSMRKLLLKRLTLLQARDTNVICCKNACYGAWRWVRRCDVDWDFS